MVLHLDQKFTLLSKDIHRPIEMIIKKHPHVIKMTYITLFISLAANHWFLHLLDVKIVFLNGILEEEVHMEQTT